MFDSSVRTGHEPDSRRLINRIIGVHRGVLHTRALREYAIASDQTLNLDINSSQLNFYLLDALLECFPDAQFLLTIRDCYSWLDSLINDSLRRHTSRHWHDMRRLRFSHRKKKPIYSPEEQPLRARGLYTLDGYLAYWAFHNASVLAKVPSSRLLILKTTDISSSAVSVADFAGLPRSTIDLSKTHAFKNPVKYSILNQIDNAYLEAKVAEHCGSLMTDFFPGIDARSILGF